MRRTLLLRSGASGRPWRPGLTALACSSLLSLLVAGCSKSPRESSVVTSPHTSATPLAPPTPAECDAVLSPPETGEPLCNQHVMGSAGPKIMEVHFRSIGLAEAPAALFEARRARAEACGFTIDRTKGLTLRDDRRILTFLPASEASSAECDHAPSALVRTIVHWSERHGG